MARLGAALLRAPLRRASPSWSVQVAAWRVLLAPRQQPKGGVGVGAKHMQPRVSARLRRPFWHSR
eukprot:2375330-Pyramimonas_sp.AAC.1